MTWNDAIDVEVGNPLCDCGLWSRFDWAGSGGRIGSGKGFFNCAVGACRFWCQGGIGLKDSTGAYPGSWKRVMDKSIAENKERLVGEDVKTLIFGSSTVENPSVKEGDQSIINARVAYFLETMDVMEKVTKERIVEFWKFHTKIQTMLCSIEVEVMDELKRLELLLAAIRDEKLKPMENSNAGDVSSKDAGAVPQNLTIGSEEMRNGALHLALRSARAEHHRNIGVMV